MTSPHDLTSWYTTVCGVGPRGVLIVKSMRWMRSNRSQLACRVSVGIIIVIIIIIIIIIIELPHTPSRAATLLAHMVRSAVGKSCDRIAVLLKEQHRAVAHGVHIETCGGVAHAEAFRGVGGVRGSARFVVGAPNGGHVIDSEAQIELVGRTDAAHKRGGQKKREHRSATHQRGMMLTEQLTKRAVSRTQVVASVSGELAIRDVFLKRS